MGVFGLLALISILTPAHADEVTKEAEKLQVKASARVRHEFSDFTNYQNSRQMSLLRVRPQIQYRADEKTFLYFAPQFSRTLGDAVPEQTSGVAADPTFGVHEAYLGYSISDESQVLVGRQVLSFGDELVVGALEWSNVGRSFDALRYRWASPSFKSDLFWAKLVEANAQGSGTGDYDFFGAYQSWNVSTVLKEFDAYLFYSKDSRGNGPDPLALGTTGLRAKIEAGDFDSRAEITQQFGRIAGSRAAANGTQADFDVALSDSPAKTRRAGIGAFYADAQYNQLFPTTHKWLGMADVFGRRNIGGGRVFGSLRASERLRLSSEFHTFFRADETLPAYQVGGTALTGSVDSARYLGSEFDLLSTYQLSEKGVLQVGGGMLFPGASLRKIHHNNPLFVYASWEVRF